MNIALVLVMLALLFIFAIALTAVIVLVARNARDAERAGYEDEIEELGVELEEERTGRVHDRRHIHALELLLADAGIPLPNRGING